MENSRSAAGVRAGVIDRGEPITMPIVKLGSRANADGLIIDNKRVASRINAIDLPLHLRRVCEGDEEGGAEQ